MTANRAWVSSGVICRWREPDYGRECISLRPRHHAPRRRPRDSRRGLVLGVRRRRAPEKRSRQRANRISRDRSSQHVSARVRAASAPRTRDRSLAFFFPQHLGARRAANAEDQCRREGYLKTRLAETFPTPPSDSIQPSAFAVGVHRKAVENGHARAIAARAAPRRARSAPAAARRRAPAKHAPHYQKRLKPKRRES